MNNVKIGDKVLILELSSYIKSECPKTPVEAMVKRVNPSDPPYIVVEINGKNWEAYDYEYEVING